MKSVAPGYTVPQNYIDYFLAGNLYPDVCGSSETGVAATQTQTTALWNQYQIGKLFQTMYNSHPQAHFFMLILCISAQDAQASNWVSLADNVTQFRNIQDVILEAAGPEGVNECELILMPVCSTSGLDRNLCLKYPSVHFIWIALTNWANFLSDLHNAFTDSTISIDTLTSTLVTDFFTPQQPPTKLIVPISIINGFFGILSVLPKFGPAGAVSGVATIANGILTQAGLDAPK